MNQPNRHSRPEPPRTGPRRSFVLTYDYPSRGSSWTSGPNAPSGSGNIDGVIAHAVDLGYRVIEEQLQQGQQAARRLRQGALNSRAIESDIKSLTDNLSQAAKSAIDAWVDILGAAGRAGSGTRAAPDRGVDFAIELRCTRPAQVTLDVRSSLGRFIPVISELKSAIPGRRSLAGAKFSLSPDGVRGALVIAIPDDLPPGVYTGEILDSATGQCGGTVSVRIDP